MDCSCLRRILRLDQNGTIRLFGVGFTLIFNEINELQVILWFCCGQKPCPFSNS